MNNDSPMNTLRFRGLFCTAAVGALILIPFAFSREVLRPEMSVVEQFEGSRYLAYWWLIGQSLSRLFVTAFASFLAIAAIVGVIWILPRRAAETAEAILSAARYTPAIGWLPLTIAIVGISNYRSQVVFVLAGAGPLVLFHLLHGLRSCSPHLILVARLSGASRWRMILLRLAAAEREAFHALRLNIGIAFVLTVVYGMLFPSVVGVERLVETLEVLRYPLLDFALFAGVLLSLGILLDQSCGLGESLLISYRDWKARISARTLGSESKEQIH